MRDDDARAVAHEAPVTGRILAGRYRVGPVLRSGGMGSVYEGEHMATGRRVALKLVHLRAPMVAELERRFEREARIASNLQSKHIVQVFDAGRDEILGPFIAMELLKGQDLEDRLAHSGPLPVQVACEIAFQAARGLEKAHAVNIAHRDLKPGNLFLVESDEDELLVKVLDFGIAKPFEGLDETNVKLTQEGTALGTPQYMSPEQARGRVDIDARTDVYSLGAVLYETLVGRSHVPELANYNQLVIHIATEPAPRVSMTLPDIDPRIDRLVADMLVGDRRDRLQTMRMVRERLAPVLGRAARQGSIADTSGSFLAGREVSSVGLSSPRLLASAPPAVMDSEEDPGGEEIVFFERASGAPGPAPLRAESPPEALGEPPDSGNGEEIVLFDRASLHLPLASDRTSSSAHVIDDSAPPRRAATAERGAPPPSQVPSRAAPPARHTIPRRTLLAAAAAAVFIIVGSARFVGSSGEAPRSAAAEPPPAESALPPAMALTEPAGDLAGATDAAALADAAAPPAR